MTNIKLLSLRICDHDANFCYFNGHNVSYVKTERLFREKHHYVELAKWQSVFEEIFGEKVENITEVAVIFDEWDVTKSEKIQNFFPAIENYTFFPCSTKVTRLNHHYAHALSYWPMTDIPDICFVLDGYGDLDKSWAVYRHDKQIAQGSCIFDGSIGIEMVQASKRIGLGKCHEMDYAGKLMGLAAYGKVDNEYLNKLRGLGIHDIERIFDYYKWAEYKGNNFVAELTKLDHFATVHEYIPDVLVNFFLKYAKSHERIFFSGGVAQNVIWNTKLKSKFPNLIIPPHSGDDGLSLGGLEFLRQKYNLKKFTLENFPFCQKDESPDDEVTDSTIKKTAQLLSEGKIIAWYQGNGEIGPRALGHRSILMDPSHPNGKNIINGVKHRETYRPFGASVLLGEAEKYFDSLPNNPYMLYVGRLKDEYSFPAITHADNTCRIQTVDESNSSFFKLLTEFKNLTGYSLLLNTSLNLSGLPIAGYVKDALKLFDDKKVDVLVIGDKIYENKVEIKYGY